MQSKSDGKAVRQIRNRAFDKLKNRDTNGLKKKDLMEAGILVTKDK